MRTTPTTSRIVPPWPATVAALISFGTLYLSSGPDPILPILALALLAVYLFGAQFVQGMRPIQFTRLLLFGGIYALSGGRQTNLMDAWGPAQALDTIAHVLAAELVIRAWQRGETGGGRRMIGLSGFIMLIACATDNARLIEVAAPIYFFFLILALRAERPAPAVKLPFRPMVLLTHGLPIALTLGTGALITQQFETHRPEIMEWGMEALGERPPTREGDVSGLSKSPVLGSTFNTPGSSTRILRIVGTLPDPHLHGMCFDTYHLGSWGPDMGDRNFVDAMPAQLGADAPGPRARVTRFVNDDGMVSAPLNSAGLHFASNLTPQWAPEDGGPVRAESADALTYDIVAGPSDTYQGPFCLPLTATERRRCLLVPAEIDPRVQALAQSLAGPDASPSVRIEAVVAYLIGHNAYSLRARRGSGDPVSSFILEHKAAHCEYFASAAVILLRCLGVPTRYCIGYYAHEGDGADAIVVRGQDAHAWAESWIDGVGWVVVDATPGNGRPDQTSKSSLWWKVRDRWQDFTQGLRAWVNRLRPAQRLALIGGLGAILLASNVWRLWKARQARAGIFAYAAPPGELSALAERFEAYLNRQGSPCPPDVPWREHLSREASSTWDRERAEAFVTAYNRARFGALDAPTLTALQQSLRELEKA